MHPNRSWRREQNLLLDVLAGLFGPPAVPVEVDGPARVSVAGPDADLIRLVLVGAGFSHSTSRPVIFIDAIHVKVVTGEGTNRSVYVAVAAAANGKLDVLGLCTFGT